MTVQQAAVKLQSTQSSEAFEVLIVDDSFSVRQVVSNLIKSAGWHPVLARDGLEAFEIIQRSAVPPALILLDVEMPRMDGYELTSTLRGHAAYRDIPIIMLTSRAGEKHRHKAFEVGATEYLVKPYQDETLLSVIRQHMPQAGRVMAA
jgi:CheY-like chemotaxis protein